jgi:hypothetical protein
MQKVKYKGIVYRSVQQACVSLGITRQSVTRYTQKGLSVEQAIEQILKSKKRNSCTDYLGNKFKSMVDMAEFHHIPYSALFNRLNRKWSLEKALTTHSRKYNCTDHLGNEFESKRVMAEFYNIPYRMLINRLEIGWDIKKALTTPIGKPRGKYASKVQGQKI